MKALPLLFGAGTIGAFTPSPTAPPAAIQQQMDQQAIYDNYGEDSELETGNIQPSTRQQKPKQSKPAPKLALLAGVRIVTGVARKVGLLCIMPTQELRQLLQHLLE